jgi:hypothetical protein
MFWPRTNCRLKGVRPCCLAWQQTFLTIKAWLCCWLIPLAALAAGAASCLLLLQPRARWPGRHPHPLRSGVRSLPPPPILRRRFLSHHPTPRWLLPASAAASVPAVPRVFLGWSRSRSVLGCSTRQTSTARPPRSAMAPRALAVAGAAAAQAAAQGGWGDQVPATSRATRLIWAAQPKIYAGVSESTRPRCRHVRAWRVTRRAGWHGRCVTDSPSSSTATRRPTASYTMTSSAAPTSRVPRHLGMSVSTQRRGGECCRVLGSRPRHRRLGLPPRRPSTGRAGYQIACRGVRSKQQGGGTLPLAMGPAAGGLLRCLGQH